MVLSDKIRRRAWARRTDLGFALDTVTSAKSLLSALAASTGICVYPVAASDPALGGAEAVLDITLNAIYMSDGIEESVQNFYAAHEYGHWFVHGADGVCSHEDLSLDLDELVSLPVSVVDGYSAHERQESEANVFASELLLPLPLALYCFQTLKWNAGRIAMEIGVSEAVVRRQLTDAVLLPLPRLEEDVTSASPAPLDSSQLAAATARHGPLLLTAGPGTGKTRTLVGRCIHLTQERGVRAESILALTFSRKAASEMRERLELAGIGGGGSGPWIGTFHSFGMEVLRKYGDRIGLDPDFHLIDEMDGISLLENNLAKLDLKHLRSIQNPAYHLSGILRQISRAKDELRSPEEYTALAESMMSSARTAYEESGAKDIKKRKKHETEIAATMQKAARAVEVARTYAAYQSLLTEANLVDYADLIARSVDLLEGRPEIRAAFHARYPHVLADEYQDVNRASARLLRLLVDRDASGLWVVGDHRQSIYQFQGASPANVSLFLSDYPTGVLHRLEVNYRSVQQIVDTFHSASRHMSFAATASEPARWIARRGGSLGSHPAATLAALNTSAGQYDYIAEEVQALRALGTAYSGMAVLCRKHSQAREAASRLTAAGIPVLYLGQLLERPEVKDLINLIALVGDGQTASLTRVAAMKEYGLTQAEAAAVAASLQRVSASSTNDLAQIAADLDLSERAISGVLRLSSHLRMLQPFVNQPATLIRTYLFDCSQFLDLMAPPDSAEFGQTLRKLAVRQFIGIVEGFDHRVVAPSSAESGNRCCQLLDYLRRIAAVGASTSAPEDGSISQIDAVRVSTVHGAKGLEFPAVFIPNLNDGQFPSRTPHGGIPEVTGLSLVESEEADEEECLFFVGLSRARDHLYVTRPFYRANGSPANPSVLLSTLADAVRTGAISVIDHANETSPAEPPAAYAEESAPAGVVLPMYSSSELESYERCPRRYWYEKIQHLSGTAEDDGYRKLHAAVNGLVDWVESQTPNTVAASASDRLRKLDELWAERGPVGHLHERLYRAEAELIASAEPRALDQKPKQHTLTAKLSNALVHVRPDVVSIEDGSISITRRIVGSPGGSDHTHKRLALFRKAAADSYPELMPTVQLHYLEDGTVVTVPENPRYEPNRVAKYEAAVDGIQANVFPASPANADTCKTCQFLFICPRICE